MKAKVAVTTNRKGDKLTEHAGHVRFFKIYEIDEEEGVLSAKVIKVDKEHVLHNLLHSPNINLEEHEVLKSQILLTGGVGQGAIHKLYQLGVRAYLIEEKNPDEAIKQLIEGTLKALDPASFHHDHDHNHDHGHGHGHHHHH